jgi:glycine cleavage system regulatory protein
MRSGRAISIVPDRFAASRAELTAIVVVAFDADDGADSVLRVTNFLPEQGIGIATAASCGLPKS